MSAQITVYCGTYGHAALSTVHARRGMAKMLSAFVLAKGVARSNGENRYSFGSEVRAEAE